MGLKRERQDGARAGWNRNIWKISMILSLFKAQRGCNWDLRSGASLGVDLFHPVELRTQLTNALIPRPGVRSEEHTSELQSQSNLVCRLLLEKKKKTNHLCMNTSRIILRTLDAH